jgi:PST family polysaccharide transporter
MSAAPTPEQYLRTDHLESTLRATTIRGGATTLASQAFKFLLSFASTMVAARLLTPGDYGLVGMVTVITGLITTLSHMGLSAATVQCAALTHRQVSTLFWANAALGVAMMALVSALAPFIAAFYSEPRLFGIAVTLSAAFALSGLSVQHLALLRRQMRFSRLAAIEIGGLLMSISVLLAAAWMGYGYWSIIFMSLSQTAGTLIGAWIACGWRPGRPARLSEIRTMLAFGGNVTGYTLVNYLARNVDNLLIGRFFGPQKLGLYDKAYSLLMLPLHQINAPITAVAIPALSRIAGHAQRFRDYYIRMAGLVCLITMPLAAFVLATGDWVVLIALGPQWEESGRIFAWLGLAAFVQPIAHTTGWVFVSQNRVREQLRWGLVGSSLSVASIVAGLPWGPVGVAAVYSISGILIRTPLLFRWASVPGVLTARDYYMTAAPYALASTVAVAAIAGMRSVIAFVHPILGLASAALLAAIVILLTLWTLPSGRRALFDVHEVMITLRKGDKVAL